MLSLVHTPVKFKAIFFHGLLEASNAMVYPLSTNRSRVGALTFATLLLVGFTSCTNQYQHQADERPKASSAPDNETATVDTTAIPIADRSYFPVLADAYRRVDPKADGWGTEAFSEQAAAKLKYLKAYLKSGQTDDLNSLIAPSAQSTAFFPSEFDLLHSSGNLEIENAASLPTDPTEVGSTAVIAALQSFREHLHNNVDHTELKIVSVVPQEDNVVSELKATLLAHSSSQQHQVNATWQCTWTPDAKQITQLVVTKYQQVLISGKPRLFADVTSSVFGQEKAWTDQFQFGTDHWRARLTRNLGLDVASNHGLALGDLNGDQLDDLYVLQEGGLPNRLFLRQADGSLKDHSAASGADWLDYCASALIIDVDNDGDRDLLVTTELKLLVMKNDGRANFTLAGQVKLPAQTFSVTAADYDLDGDLDIYACGYNPVARGERETDFGDPIPFHDANNGGASVLLQNDGTGAFSDQTQAAGLDANNRRFSFSASWEDYDNDGDPDLYVANDYGRNNLYRNDDGHFTDVAPAVGVEDGAAGMSVSWGDPNRDGKMDVYVSNMFSAAGNRISYQRQFKPGASSALRAAVQHIARGNTLFENTGDGFNDISVDAGVTFGRWAWGSRFCDINNDGYEDLLVANGFVSTASTADL